MHQKKSGMAADSMRMDALLAAMPGPASSDRLDSLEEGVWQAVLRRRQMLRRAGFGAQVLTVLCVVSGSFYLAQAHGRDVVKESALRQVLTQDFLLVAPE